MADEPINDNDGDIPFLFLQLPPEIRNMIYTLIFTARNSNHLITPDPLRSRIRNNMAQNLRPISQCLALLRTCRQAHSEATSVLYGDNTFYFTDTPHGDRLCRSSCHPNRAPLPCCDFVGIYPFLTRSGSDMRAKIRRVRLGFTSCLIVEYAYAIDRNPAKAGEAYLGRAMKLLAAGDRLPVVEVKFDFYGGSYRNWEMRRKEEERSVIMRELFERHVFEMLVAGKRLSRAVGRLREEEVLRFVDFV